MEESRDEHVSGYFPSPNDENKASARKKVRSEKGFKASVFMGIEKATLKIKTALNFKTALKVAKPVKPSVRSHQAVAKSGTIPKQPKDSFPKPPFVVPGRIRHNDSHLLQAFPPQTVKYLPKNPPKSVKSICTAAKPLASQTGAINKQPASSKLRPVRPVETHSAIVSKTHKFQVPAGTIFNRFYFPFSNEIFYLFVRCTIFYRDPRANSRSGRGFF